MYKFKAMFRLNPNKYLSGTLKVNLQSLRANSKE